MAPLLGPAPCRRCRTPLVWTGGAWREFIEWNPFDLERGERVPVVGDPHGCYPSSLKDRLATYVGRQAAYVLRDQAHPVLPELELRYAWGDR